jgi:stage II sporulation protein M
MDAMGIIQFYRNYFFELKKWIGRVSVWFLVSIIIGGLAFVIDPGLMDKIIGVFEDKFGETPDLDSALALDIYLNNLQASGLAIAGGLLVGLGPFLAAAINGFLLGYIIVGIPVLSGSDWLVSIGTLAVGLIPHGIIEIPAFLLAAAIGLKLGTEWLKQENYGNRLNVLWKNIKLALYGIPVIIVALAIAAVIEVYVSGKLLDIMTK